MLRVLLLESESTVRRFIESALEKSGFEALRAGDCASPEAPHDCQLECCGATGAPDLVIAAVVSPRVCSGVEAAVKAMRRWRVKALLISATPADVWPRESRALLDSLPVDVYSFLAKPFTSDRLIAAVSALTAPAATRH